MWAYYTSTMISGVTENDQQSFNLQLFDYNDNTIIRNVVWQSRSEEIWN